MAQPPPPLEQQNHHPPGGGVLQRPNNNKNSSMSNKRARDNDGEPRRDDDSQERKSSRRGNDDYYGRCDKSSSGSYYGRGYDCGRGRDDDDYYRGGRGSNRERHDDWKCLECNTWNYPQDDSCARCETRASREPRNRRRSDSRGYRHDRRRNDQGTDFEKALYKLDQDADEFGRTKARKEKNTTTATEWPSCFQENGAAYVFDARSGFFYEATSDFFYDPKTKLYYGNKKKLYFQYSPDKDPPFTELPDQNAAGVEGSGGGAILLGVADTPHTPSSAPEKKKIAISLKTKSLPEGKQRASKASKGTARAVSKEATDAKAKAAEQSRLQKKHAAHMEMWSERGKEMRNDNDTPSKPVAKTTKGQPICLLCKRKFASIEKLRKHEELSALHKENLAKKAASEKEQADADAKTMNAASEYRDRAKERRVMYGPESGTVGLAQAAVMAEEPRQTQVVKPEESLGETNIGNQMLQKLGWKSGVSLGRKQQDSSRATNTGDDERGRDDLQQNIKKDWQRIETMAGNDAGRRSGSGGGLGS